MEPSDTGFGYCHPHECWMFETCLHSRCTFLYTVNALKQAVRCVITRAGPEKNARRHLHRPLEDSWHGDWGVARLHMAVWAVVPWLAVMRDMLFSSGLHYYFLGSDISPFWIITVGKPTPISPQCKFHFSQDCQVWENATVNIRKVAGMKCLLSHVWSLEPPKGHPWQSHTRDFSLQDGSFRKGSWVLEQDNGKWKEVFTIKDILLGIFLVAFYKMKMKGEFIIERLWSCSLVLSKTCLLDTKCC